MDTIIQKTKAQILEGKRIGPSEAMALYLEGRRTPFALMAAASEIRERFKGKRISLCGIVNAKSGRCREDCRFCAQSGHWRTETDAYPLMGAGEIVSRARAAESEGAHLFGIVTSGTRISEEKEWQAILEAVRGIAALSIKPCASLGMLDGRRARELKAAGLYRYHHNLETARSFFSAVCTTHDYEEDVATVRAARAAGLSTCSGGIIGMGESIEQRIELTCLLGELGVDSVPVNILNPIPGTPLMAMGPLPPIEVLLTIAVFRFILPDRDIKLCGGKERNLRQLLPLGIVAGANSLMTGNYLTTTGRETVLDLEMIGDLGLQAGYGQGSGVEDSNEE